MGKILVLSGPSGSGKNTVYDGLLKKDSSIAQTVSATTRKPRDGEKDGVDYFFLSEEAFKSHISAGDFVEYNKYGSNYYGTLKSEITRLCEMQKTVVLIIDVNGAINFKKAFPDSVTVFLLPPSEDVLIKRLRSRGTDSEDDVLTRLAIAKDEMLKADKYDYRVVNDELEKCIDEVYEIINNI